MPKDPIQRRTLLFDRCHRNTRGDSTVRLLDWCLVDTNLGGMVEPRQMVMAPIGAGPNLTANLDMDELSFNEIKELDEGTMLDLVGTTGLQLPMDYNTR